MLLCRNCNLCAEYTRFTDASLQLGFFEFCLCLFLKLLKFHCHSHVAGYLQFPREKSLLRVQLARHEVKQVRVGSLKRDVRLRRPVELDFPLSILCVHDPRCLSALVPLDLEREDALDVLHEVLAVCVEGSTDSVKYHSRLEVTGQNGGIL